MSYFGIPIRNGLPIGLGSVAPLASGGGSPFSPLSLFSGGAPGAWYDPSDYTTLFQDSAGTTPVTAVEQPVGLMLDKSQGLALGSEVITPEANRDFSSDTGYWSKEGGATISGGVVNVNTAVDNYPIYRFNTAPAGYFELTYTITLVTGGLRVVTGASSGTQRTASGTYTERLYNPALGTLGFRTFGPCIGTIDNVSMKAVSGNHAFQATSASRPVLSARYNLLTKTEQFDDAVWKKLTTGTAVAPVVTANYGIAPDGTQTATRIQLDRGDGVCIFYQEFQAAVSVSLSEIAYIKTNDGSTKTISFGDSAAGPDVITVTGTWQKFTSIKSVAQVGKYIEFATRATTSQVADILVWQPQSVPANQSTLPYQRVNTATDYATTGFLPYLRFDGVDDSLSTNSISFTATDKMSVFAGVRKLSSAGFPTILESSANVGSNAGTFNVFASGSTSNSPGYIFGSRGTSAVTNASVDTGYAAPVTNTLTGIGNIAADTCILRVNGTQVASNAADQGTGNYGNFPLYIGSRAGTSLPFNGQLYSMVIVGKAVTAGELTSTEAYVNLKTGAY